MLTLLTRNRLPTYGSMYLTHVDIFATYREGRSNSTNDRKAKHHPDDKKSKRTTTTGNLDEKQENHAVTILTLFTKNRLPTNGSIYLTRVDVFAMYRKGRNNPTNNRKAKKPPRRQEI